MAALPTWPVAVHLVVLGLQVLRKASGQFAVRSPGGVVVQAVGEDAVLPCYVSAPGVPASLTVQWLLFRPPERIEISSFTGRSGRESHGKGYEGRAALFASQVRRGNLSLKLRSIRVSDKGKYICRVGYSSWHRETYLELDVTAPFRILPSASPVVGVAGRDVLLPCLLPASFAGDLVVRWRLLPSTELLRGVVRAGRVHSERTAGRFRGRAELPPAELRRGNFSLVLRSVTRADGGAYVCSLRSDGWRDEAAVELEVTGLFHILPPDSPAVGFIGEDVVLPCQLSLAALPRATTVQWLAVQPRGTQEVSYNAAVRESWLEERSWGGTELFPGRWGAGNLSLRLENVQLPDRGKYICRVTAGPWQDQVAIELEVTVPVPSALPSTYVAAAAGDDVLLDCQPPATSLLPNASTQWLLSRPRELTPVVSSSTSTGNEGYRGQRALPWASSVRAFSLLLKGVRASDAGIYICRVSAGERQHQEAFELDVV